MRQYFDDVRDLWIIFDDDGISYSEEVDVDSVHRGEPLVSLSLFIGRRCPFRCRYCYNQISRK